MNRGLCWLLCWLLCWPLAAGAADDTLTTVMQRLAEVKTVEAHFQEEKTLAMLQQRHFVVVSLLVSLKK